MCDGSGLEPVRYDAEGEGWEYACKGCENCQ